MLKNTRFLQIKASAGSGKTFTLTQRFLHLLAHAQDKEVRELTDFDRFHSGVNPYSEGECEQGYTVPYLWTDILAMTFTNSAATEMKERILRELKKLALSNGENNSSSNTLTSKEIVHPKTNHTDFSNTLISLNPKQAAKWVDCIIRRYGALNIRTIDSLLTMLVRLSALELNIPPDFEPAFDSKAFFDPLMDAVLEDARHESHPLHTILREACLSLLLYKGIEGQKGFTAGDKIRHELHALLDWHLQNDKPLPSVHVADMEKLLRAMYDAVRITAQILMHKTREEELDMLVLADKGFTACTTLYYPDKVNFSTYVEKANLQACLKKKSKEPSSQAEQAFAEFQEQALRLKKDGQALRKAMVELPLVHLVREVVRRQEQYQRREGKVPASLLPKLASQAVHNEYGASIAFCRMSSRLSHVFIDEFQDTSHEQWGAIQALGLETLSQGGALTLIGDVKQAIYGWRGGDSSLFDKAMANEELKNVSDVSTINLFTNWRSAKAIVEHNNEVFKILAHKEHASAILKAMLPKETPFAVLKKAADAVSKAFEKSEQLVAPIHAQTDGYVEIHHIESESRPELHDDLREQVKKLFDDNLAKRHAWRDIAVLVRGNSQAKEVAQWLMSWGIPVITSNSLRLADHPIICQTIAMLSFVDYPKDDIAFWECVTGHELFVSVSGHNRQYFEDWLATQRHQARQGPLFTMFRADFPKLWDACFAPFYSRAGLMSAYDTVREIFYRYEVFDRYPHEAGFLRRFLEIVYNAESQGYVSLSTFLDFWRNEAMDEKVPMPEGMDAVQVMTMHKSKGLQFPVVVIPYHQSSDIYRAKLVDAVVCGHDMVLPECKELGEVYYEAQADEAREKLHLLYVAWTRAEKELYGFVTNTTKHPSKFSNAIMDLLQLAREVDHAKAQETGGQDCQELEQTTMSLGTNRIVCQRGSMEQGKRGADLQGHIISIAPENAGVKTEQDDNAQKPQVLLERNWRPMQWLPRLKIFRNALPEVQFNESQRGMLVHSCLEHLRLGGHGVALDEANIADHVLTAVQNAMRAFRLPIPEPLKVEHELICILTWFAHLPQASTWLAHGTPEQAILDSHGNRHRVDLLVDYGHELVVVEYKTGHASQDHVGQVRRYLNLLTAMNTGQKAGASLIHSCRAVIVYLDLQRLVGVGPKDDATFQNTIVNHETFDHSASEAEVIHD